MGDVRVVVFCRHCQLCRPAGMLTAKIVGYVLDWTGSYVLVFMIAGSAYLVALLIFHLLAPRLEPARVE
jgi:MFS transporter, ACS family, hexuronate transporter